MPPFMAFICPRTSVQNIQHLNVLWLPSLTTSPPPPPSSSPSPSPLFLLVKYTFPFQYWKWSRGPLPALSFFLFLPPLLFSLSRQMYMLYTLHTHIYNKTNDLNNFSWHCMPRVPHNFKYVSP